MTSKPCALSAVAFAAALLVGCSSAPATAPEGASASPSAAQETPTPTPTPETDLQSIIDAVKGGVPEIGEVVEVTEDNDPNDLIGRPNGYVSAAVFYDGRLSCDELSAECGATLEEWADADAAQGRSDYIQGILAETPAFDSEYHYLVGAFLLRVSGDLKPSEAEAYDAAVTALQG